MMESAMTAQKVFLYPANVIYEFLLSLFSAHSFGGGIDLLFIVAIAILFWGKIFHIISAVIRRIFGFEKG
jgi:hypothetical protein